MPLRTEQDIVSCRQAARKLCQDLKFSVVDQTKMITAASELARNTVVHGGGGEMGWEALCNGAKVGLRLVFEDKGPGIPDIGLALTDGFSTGKSMGLGLPGSKRLVNEFDIATVVGRGTRVTIARWK